MLTIYDPSPGRLVEKFYATSSVERIHSSISRVLTYSVKILESIYHLGMFARQLRWGEECARFFYWSLEKWILAGGLVG